MSASSADRGAGGERGAGPLLAPDASGHVYEVFRQEKDGDPMRHAGNLVAPDDALALDYAREFYSRRQESHRLWVVRRDAIRDLDDPDLLRPPLDRSFKKPGGYVMRDKLDAARQRAGTTKPAARIDTPGGAKDPTEDLPEEPVE
ncbi:MAG TPA: hypothetical protein VFK38_04560 [Candidatus Limnocylindrales bacterium]|nr:hypothetical protein [Candidatus Limnocylindrales bacterium]